MESLIKMFSEIRRGVPSLNNGGCGLFTYFMIYELRKKGIPCSIYYLDQIGSPVKVNNYLESRNNVNNRKPVNGLSASHFMVHLDDYYFDGYRFKDDPDGTTWDISDEGYYSLSRLRFSIAKGNWNWEYDKRNNKKLYKIIKKHIDKIEKEYVLVKKEKESARYCTCD